MTLEQTISDKLRTALNPSALTVLNESHLHAGHAGSPGTGESHFRVTIVTDVFAGKSRIERHRMINQVLATELSGRIHALSIDARSEAER